VKGKTHAFRRIAEEGTKSEVRLVGDVVVLGEAPTEEEDGLAGAVVVVEGASGEGMVGGELTTFGGCFTDTGEGREPRTGKSWELEL